MFKPSPNAITILKSRSYFHKDENWESFCRRVAQAPNHSISLENNYYEIISEAKFLPNSPTLLNAGKETGRQLFACFVLPIGDSLKGIFKTLSNAAKIFQTGGGVGYSFSRLREKGSAVSSGQGTTSGVISFMSLYNQVVDVVKQGGVRRGAQMGVLRVDHPEIEDFIVCKTKEGNLANFNISVAITDKFIEAVKVDTNFDLISPYNSKVVKTIKARDLWDKIIHQAWLNGEPGVIFIDEVNRKEISGAVIEAPNPCSEQFLPPYGSCCLGSIDVSKFVYGEKNFDWDELERVINFGVSYLDGLIDVNEYPLPEIEEVAKKDRRIGLGIMGFADALIKMKIPYDSDQAFAFARDLAQTLQETSHDKSDGKNLMTTTIAPTGTLSIVAGCSSGIEPNFAWEYSTNRIDRVLKEYHPLYKEWNAERVRDGRSTDLPNYFVTADQVSPEDHVKMQAIFQEYIDNGISKTINMPNSATEENVKKAYMLAYELKCKGITVYRDGSRETQVLDKGTKKKEKKSVFTKRPETLIGRTIKKKTSHGNLYLTINEFDGQPVELFCTLGKAGTDLHAIAEGLARSITLNLKYHVPIKEIIRQLQDIGGENVLLTQKGIVRSIPDAITQVFEELYMEKKEETTEKKPHVKCESCTE